MNKWQYHSDLTNGHCEWTKVIASEARWPKNEKFLIAELL